jgi:hypothetical protein
MAIFFITLKETKSDGTRQAFPFKCDCASGADLIEQLAKGGKNGLGVPGTQLVYQPGPEGTKIVTRESFRTLRLEKVDDIQQSNARFVFETRKAPAEGAFDGMRRDGMGLNTGTRLPTVSTAQGRVLTA